MSLNATERSAAEAAPTTAAREPARVRIEAWSFKGAYLAVFLVMAFGWGIGIPIRRVFVDHDASTLNVFALVVGSISALSFLSLNAARVLEFFLSVRVGVAILTFFLLGSIASVLVHPREPEKYLDQTLENRERSHRADAAWAHGFFVYNLLHPYGIGLPKYDVPGAAKPALERIAKRYGSRVSKQEASGMRTALNGQVRGDEIRAFNARHADALNAFYDVASFLQLNGTKTGKGAWSSDWFTTLMGLLFLAVLMNTFRRGFARAIAQGGPGFAFVPKLPSALAWDLRSLVSVPRIGFLCTHLGVMTALIGGVVSRATEERGILQLSIDPMRDEMPQRSIRYRTYAGEVRPLVAGDESIGVELSDFRADYRDTLEVEFLGDPAPPRNMMPRYRWYEAWSGRQIPLDYDENDKARIVVRIKDHYPRAALSFRLVERGPNEEPKNPVEASGAILELTWRLPDGRSFTRRLFAGHPELSVWDDFPGMRIRVESAGDGTEQRARATAPLEPGPVGELEVWVGDDATKPAAKCPIEKGASVAFETEAGRASAEVLTSLADARLLPTPSGGLEPLFASRPAEQVAPLHPGAELRLTAPAGQTGRMWVYEDPNDSMSESPNMKSIGGTPVRFRVKWNHWTSPAIARYRIVLAPNLPAQIARVGGEAPIDLPIGGSIDLGSAGKLTLDQRADRPRLIPEIEPMSGDADADDVFFDARNPGAVRVEVDGPAGKQEFLLAAKPLADTADYAGLLGLRLFEDQMELPREWKSKLTFYRPEGDGWKEDASGTIRVNDYFHYRGYRFFQTDANPRIPGYSGVGVVYDPGIETVLVGMWAVIAGVAYVFFLKPFLVKRAAP